MDEQDVLARLELRAAEHAREAERYRIAAEVLRSELRSGRAAAARTRGDAGTSARSRDQQSQTSTTTMVERAISESPVPLHPNDILREAQRLGWETDSPNPLNTARTAAHRLAKAGRIRRLPDGRFSLLAATSTDVAETAETEPHTQRVERQSKWDDPWSAREASMPG